jgi:hypothetical protein
MVNFIKKFKIIFLCLGVILLIATVFLFLISNNKIWLKKNVNDRKNVVEKINLKSFNASYNDESKKIVFDWEVEGGEKVKIEIYNNEKLIKDVSNMENYELSVIDNNYEPQNYDFQIKLTPLEDNNNVVIENNTTDNSTVKVKYFIDYTANAKYNYNYDTIEFNFDMIAHKNAQELFPKPIITDENGKSISLTLSGSGSEPYINDYKKFGIGYDMYANKYTVGNHKFTIRWVFDDGETYEKVVDVIIPSNRKTEFGSIVLKSVNARLQWNTTVTDEQGSVTTSSKVLSIDQYHSIDGGDIAKDFIKFEFYLTDNTLLYVIKPEATSNGTVLNMNIKLDDLLYKIDENKDYNVYLKMYYKDRDGNAKTVNSNNITMNIKY